MSIFKDFEEFESKKQGLLDSTYNFKNTDIPIIQTFDELKEEYLFGDMRKDRVKMLDQQLANISKAIKCKTDFIPFLEPWHCIGVYANSFGCKIKFSDVKDPDTLWAIDKPEDVYNLKPDINNSELMNMTLDTIKFFQDKVGTSIPITTCDPNSPMLCASLVLKTDVFLMSLMTNPKEMHHLIDLTTKVFLEFYQRQLDLLKNPAFPGHGFLFTKNATGVCVSEDNLAQIPPAIFEEFEVLSLEKIAEKFGGVYVHSCGNWIHNLDSVLKIKGLKGINFHSSPVEMDPEIVLKKIKASGKDIAVFTDFGQIGIKWTDNYKDEKDAYVNWFLKKICYDGIPKGVFITTFGNYPKITKYGYGYCRENISVEQASSDYDWIKNEINKLISK